MEYPTFYLDENGNIVSDIDDMDNPEENSDLTELHPDLPMGTVSGNNTYYIYQLPLQDEDPALVEAQLKNLEENNAALADISDNLERILQEQASSAGYLSSSALDTFDRVVQGYNYDYYIAFRYDSDSYNAVMYLADKITPSGTNIVLQDALSVRLYRIYNSSTRVYTYHYTIDNPGDVSVNLSGNLMYYTNCTEGYPTLGQQSAPGHYPGWFIPLLSMIVIVALISLVRRKS